MKVEMDISSLEKATKSLEERLRILDESNDSMMRDACIYSFKRTYEIGLKMINRCLKEISANPDEIEKYTFYQMIRKAHEESLIAQGVQKWKGFRECRIKVSESFDEKITDEIVASFPEFLGEINHFISKLTGTQHGRL
ncbi:MAG: nucleotidyltransferase substrate binding protein [Bacteriovoracales bacterium]|nr:nucleotidyltransferase substrate binding protein [Bacteriovoracales bacterium]